MIQIMCFVLNAVFDFLVLVITRIYRWVVSPLIHLLAGPGFGCRFEPTCSEYTQEALHTHGPLGGSWLALRRVSRCHPFGSSGFDPVPMRNFKTSARGQEARAQQ